MTTDERWKTWKETRDESHLSPMVESFRPMIEREIYKFSSTPVPPSALRAEATRNVMQAIKTYDPDKGALSTHVTNHLKGMNRYAAQFQTAASIPEARRLKISAFKEANEKLRDRFEREPTSQEVADELSWPMAEVSRMKRELRGQIIDSADPALQELGFEHTPDVETAMRYVYPELDAKEKLVFEHTYGYGGTKKLSNNTEIAKAVGVSPTTVRNIKMKIGHKFLPFLEQ